MGYHKRLQEEKSDSVIEVMDDCGTIWYNKRPNIDPNDCPYDFYEAGAGLIEPYFIDRLVDIKTHQLVVDEVVVRKFTNKEAYDVVDDLKAKTVKLDKPIFNYEKELRWRKVQPIELTFSLEVVKNKGISDDAILLVIGAIALVLLSIGAFFAGGGLEVINIIILAVIIIMFVNGYLIPKHLYEEVESENRQLRSGWRLG